VRWIVGAIVSLVAAGSTVAAHYESQEPQTLLDVVRDVTAACGSGAPTFMERSARRFYTRAGGTLRL